MAHRNSFRGHGSLLWFAKGETIKLASRAARRSQVPPGGIIPFRWAASSRFGGRLRSESANPDNAKRILEQVRRGADRLEQIDLD